MALLPRGGVWKSCARKARVVVGKSRGGGRSALWAKGGITQKDSNATQDVEVAVCAVNTDQTEDTGKAEWLCEPSWLSAERMVKGAAGSERNLHGVGTVRGHPWLWCVGARSVRAATLREASQ